MKTDDKIVKMSTEQILIFTFGIVFIITMLVLAIAFPNPTAFQYNVFRIILAIAIAGIAAFIPGFINLKLGAWLKAGGALAVFAIVYFFNPAQLISTPLDDPKFHDFSDKAPRASGSSSRAGDKYKEQSPKSGPLAPSSLENKVPPSPTTFSRPEKEVQKFPPRTRKNEAQERASLRNTADAGKFNLQITGSTEVEKDFIKRRIVDLGVKSASISFVKSELDDSRNINIYVVYTDDVKRSYSFNTPLKNAASVIVSKIDKRSDQ